MTENWYKGHIDVNYIPVCRKFRQTEYARKYPLELWSFQSLMKDYGEGVRDWVKQATQEGRRLAMHFFVMGKHIDRIYYKQRTLWPKAWREISKYIEFAILPEPDCWYDIPLLQGRKLQHMAIDMGEDLMEAGVPCVWLLLDIKEGGERDIDWYANYANKRGMKYVACNNTGARDPQTFKEMLANMSAYHERLNPDIGVIVNGPGAQRRIRAVLRVFEGRQVVFANAARIERQRRML